MAWSGVAWRVGLEEHACCASAAAHLRAWLLAQRQREGGGQVLASVAAWGMWWRQGVRGRCTVNYPRSGRRLVARKRWRHETRVLLHRCGPGNTVQPSFPNHSSAKHVKGLFSGDAGIPHYQAHRV